ncbi:hypothetical protein ATZ33_12315 [Enterococcus silesiacus]|nr:GyrI-like domain-containing protein [Enterococcus silesiacus]ALS02137.1 hypothetical protein ATZ33_12315 [Enterococcus silesiacus]
MNYRTEQKKAFIIAGYRQEMKKIEQDENFYEISNFWSNLTEATINQIMAVTDGTLQGLLGVSDSNKSQEQFKYMIGTKKNPDQTTSNDLAETQFPASKWAIIECVGAILAGVKALDENQPFEPNVLMQLKQSTRAPWADEGIHENIEIPRIEFYPFGDMEAEDYKCELWIPIKDEKR